MLSPLPSSSFKSHQFNCFITIIFILLYTVTTQSYNFQTISIHSLKEGNTIYGIAEYNYLFISKSLNITNKEILFSQIINNKNNNSVKNKFQFGMERNLFKQFEMYFEFHNISSNFYSISPISFAPLICRTRNPFEILSGIVTSEISFSEQVRCYRDRLLKTNQHSILSYYSNNFNNNFKNNLNNNNIGHDNSFINSYDFIPIPLFPNKVIIGNEFNDEISNISNDELNKLERFILPLTVDYENNDCFNNPHKFDALRISLMNGISNFTNFDLEWMKKISNIQHLNYDRSIYTFMYNRFKNRNNFLQNLTNYYEISQTLLSSECNYCNLGSFGDPRETFTDLWAIPHIVLTLVYFILLFGTKSYSKPYIQRRLIVPYLVPICNLIFEILCLDSFIVLVYNCEPSYLLISIFFAISIIFLYMMTVVRFYYLRNLYKIVSDSKFYKIHKYLTSTLFGIIFILVISIILTFLCMIPVIIILNYYDTNIIYIAQNVSNAGFVVLGSSFAFLAIIIDVILNRKKISKNGILYYLFADDPLYVRIDLFLTGLIIVILLITVVFQLFELLYLVGLVRVLVTVMALMISGGTSIIAELIRRFIYRKRKIQENETELEKHLSQSSDFFELFQEYASKEFSLENIMLFDIVHEIKTIYVPVERLIFIEENFMRNYSKYEVNISSSSRKKFYELFNSNVDSTHSTTNGNSGNSFSNINSINGGNNSFSNINNINGNGVEMNMLESTSSLSAMDLSQSNQDLTIKSKLFSNVTLQQLKDTFYIDLIGNMKDTYGRLQLTPQYAKWESVYTLQNKAAII